MKKPLNSIERIYSDPKVTFSELIKSIINNKIDEIVNNAKKVNTATSQFSKEGWYYVKKIDT
ncbi:hypothetical protein P4U23_14765 [Aeribacillus composti]|uniref:hypothetical protein n=1 Tax=Aeribacillus composti TaxID=1868734 RepID=UPI002E1C363C|nr:hypothetical protein [Aeribacillus composti]